MSLLWHRKNSPQTVVYNQCSNIVLEYAIKSDEGHKRDVPREIGRSQQRLPDPPKPGSADVIVAGFPWYVMGSLSVTKMHALRIAAVNPIPASTGSSTPMTGRVI